MTARLESTEAGDVEVVTDRYRLVVDAAGWAELTSPDGETFVRLSLLCAFDTTEGPDETIALETPVHRGGDEPSITVRRRSTRWDEASVTLHCRAEGVEVTSQVRSRARLADVRLRTVRLLGGHSLMTDRLGPISSGSEAWTLFSPNPEDPRGVLRSARAPAVIGAVGDSLPGRGHWFFTPAPLYFALAREAAVTDSAQVPAGRWLGLGVLAAPSELAVPEVSFMAQEEGFHLLFDYQGHTLCSGSFVAPSLLLTPGEADPYSGLRAHREALAARGQAPAVVERVRPSWWSGAMFCGWGAQSYKAKVQGLRPQDTCTQAGYDAFLDDLSAEGIVPSTVVVDDGWQREYGRSAPHLGRWPDLAGWIRQHHDAGQRVLLWWKAWDPEGVPNEWCVRNPDGVPIAIDPGHPGGRRLMEQNVTEMLAASGLDADGLKIDFTARTPSGESLTSASGAWGIALLESLLATIYRAAKAAKADALVITHVPHPGFVPYTDMVRLNDMLRLDEHHPESDLVAQMRYRAGVVASACPELLVDTDDWCAPDLASWREYLAVKEELGVPALYYTTHLDRTGEALEEQDYAALRALFARNDARARPAGAGRGGIEQ
ncbi:MAG: hypothetical protein JWM85_1575 [Acidimicrobiaceae bacterium]|nr:hypothetical protein [Acidimicrobiaceae bacterium]